MTFKLREELTITTAGDLKAELLGGLGEPGALELDGSGVAAVDLAGLQLLCAAHRSAALANKTIRFIAGGESPVIDQAARTAGFHEHVGCIPGCLWRGRPQ